MKCFVLTLLLCTACLTLGKDISSKDRSTFLPCESAKKSYKNAGYNEDDIHMIEHIGKNILISCYLAEIVLECSVFEHNCLFTFLFYVQK